VSSARFELLSHSDEDPTCKYTICVQSLFLSPNVVSLTLDGEVVRGGAGVVHVAVDGNAGAVVHSQAEHSLVADVGADLRVYSW
jgi:hypothetical protein